MDKQKHTPGPWKAAHNAPFRWAIHGPRNEWIAQTDAAFDDGSSGSPDACEANARLIAAAPDLLAVCRAVVAGTNAKNGFVGVGSDIYMAARAAIAKAEGRE